MTLRCSIVVVSRERPDLLQRCLTGLAQLDHPDFEVIVVACPEGVAAVRARADHAQIKLIPFDTPNISAARNLGIAAAAGEVVAFIDDDAVPEPLWLRLLTAPLAEGYACAGGYVLGRNGISLQWGARQVDETGHAVDLPLDEQGEPQLAEGHAIKTEGTNMALHRSVLIEMGGFDPRFRFYLDETDLNWRLAQAGHRTAIVPKARVHHGFAPSARRHPDRTPRDLSEIGASVAVYLGKHCPPDKHKIAIEGVKKAQNKRLLKLMQQGGLGADDVLRLRRSLRRGLKAGALRGDSADLSDATPPAFLPFSGRPEAERTVVFGSIWRRANLRQIAATQAQKGAVVSLFVLSRTALFHRVRFNSDGVWEQSGGIFGRSRRDAAWIRPTTLRRRVAAECERISPYRGTVSNQ